MSTETVTDGIDANSHATILVLIYLDHAATTPLRPRPPRRWSPFSRDRFGNTSGSHDISRRAKNALEEAREQAAGMLGASPSEVIFTGGGTEADNLALKGAALQTGEGSSRSPPSTKRSSRPANSSREWGASSTSSGSTDGVVDLDRVEEAVGRQPRWFR